MGGGEIEKKSRLLSFLPRHASSGTAHFYFIFRRNPYIISDTPTSPRVNTTQNLLPRTLFHKKKSKQRDAAFLCVFLSNNMAHNRKTLLSRGGAKPFMHIFSKGYAYWTGIYRFLLWAQIRAEITPNNSPQKFLGSSTFKVKILVVFILFWDYVDMDMQLEDQVSAGV